MLGLEGEEMYTSLLVALSVFFLLMKYASPKEDQAVVSNARFKAFQGQFVAVYLVMMMADWLQGPTVFKLYKEYGYTTQQNATLFIAGFGSSMIFGALAGYAP